MDSIPGWQVAVFGGVVTWIVLSSMLQLTQRLRSLAQPWVLYHVASGIPIIIRIQKYKNRWLDIFFSVLSCVVSVPFYTAFLPVLFWSGHGKLARQMTLLMAFCDYIGNCVKDIVSAPRPSSPPVKRVTATKGEEENALEYGLPSSHTLNTVCLSGYLLYYIISYGEELDVYVQFTAFFMVCGFVGLIGLGRIYLGMHSLIDIIGGLAFGLAILAFWLVVDDYIDVFVVSGQNVTSFWTALSFLWLFAYPTPERPTPSFEFHTAFTGVALGIVSGVQQTFQEFHHENVARLFTPSLTIPVFVERIFVGIPTILIVKFCSKALAKWSLPILANATGVPIRSSGYIPALVNAANSTTSSSSSSLGMAEKRLDEQPQQKRQTGYIQKVLVSLSFSAAHESFDVDTGIRFVQYVGLAWSVVDLVPSLFSQLSL
ncbi:lipid phosphate phosphatase delta [Impatiens glandulifera]|uniref:lipid phosphate phosphatase delta n=1 Tax=Impatiens glandulifera TaxID=253017 RepID=UPI001FB17D14|nr:lipid phosphate phosphatase delta [Impatiens glandulifera]